MAREGVKLLTRLAFLERAAERALGDLLNLWKGHRFRRDRFRASLRDDLSQVMGLLAEGAITPQIAARFPPESAAGRGRRQHGQGRAPTMSASKA